MSEDDGSVPRDGTDEELERLRAEVAELRDRLAATSAQEAAPAEKKKAGSRMLSVRRVLAAFLAALTGLVLVASIVGVWGARTTLNTDKWVSTVSPLPRQPAFNTAMSTYVTDQIFAVAKIQERLADALPPKATFLASPVTSSVHDYVLKRIEQFMATEQFATLWADANRIAQTQIKAILENKSKVVSHTENTVTLNFLPIINNVLATISTELPTLFGKKLELPPLSSGEVPPGLREKIGATLGVTLPQNFGQVTFYRQNELSALQDAMVTFKRFLVLLLLGTLACLVVALVVSPNRRRTVLQIGMAVVVSVVVLSAVLRAVKHQLLDHVPAGVYRDGVSVAIQTIFRTLRDRGDQLLWLGIGVAILAYLIGPGRGAVSIRRHTMSAGQAVVRTTRTTATSPALRTEASRHRDALQIGGLVVAAVLALLLTSWTSLLVVLVLLACYEIAVTLLARAAPSGPAVIGPMPHP